MSGGGLVERRTVLRDKAREVNLDHFLCKSVGHVKEMKFILKAMESYIKGLNKERHILNEFHMQD